MAKGYIYDSLMNRRIEGETNLVSPEELATKLAGKADVIKANDLITEVLDDVKVGDIVVVGNLVYIIDYVDKSGYPHSLSAILIDGENDSLNYMSYSKDSGEDWVEDSNSRIYPPDIQTTKLYKHSVSWQNDEIELEFISNNSIPLSTGIKYSQLFSLLYGSVRIISWYNANGAGTKLYDCSVVEVNRNGENFMEVYGLSENGLSGGSEDAESFNLVLTLSGTVTDTVTGL